MRHFDSDFILTFYWIQAQKMINDRGTTRLYATFCNEVGTVLRTQGNFEYALELFNKSLKIEEKRGSIEHPSVVETYVLFTEWMRMQIPRKLNKQYLFYLFFQTKQKDSEESLPKP